MMSDEDYHLGQERRGRDRDPGRDRSFSRSRSRGRDDAGAGAEDFDQNHGHEDGEENFSLYITNLDFKTTSEKLKTVFEKNVGPVLEATVVAEPHTRVSRGFAFIIMTKLEDSHKALETMDAFEVDGRAIKVEKARRKGAYDKTPGKYLGPIQLSTKYNPRRIEERERLREYDYRERDRYYRGIPPGYDRYRDDYRDRYRDDYRRDPHYDPRGPPMMYPPYDRRSRSPPPRADYHRSRSPLGGDRRLPPAPYDRHAPPFSRGSMRY